MYGGGETSIPSSAAQRVHDPKKAMQLFPRVGPKVREEFK